MRTYEDYKRILQLWELGYPKLTISERLDIPRRTVIDCIQRYENLEGLESAFSERTQPFIVLLLQNAHHASPIEAEKHREIFARYAYTLGIYLGDGEISKVRNVYRMRVALDARYPGIINYCAESLNTLLPENSVNIQDIYYRGRLSSVVVVIYFKYLVDIFPQHGTGMKHTRAIILADWQKYIVEQYPLEFFRGFFHSDGSRFNNVVNGKAYPRYQFTNCSNDIAKLFTDTCDRLGLHWTSKIRPPKGISHTPANEIYISKRRDVEYLDRVIGPKI